MGSSGSSKDLSATTSNAVALTSPSDLDLITTTSASGQDSSVATSHGGKKLL